MPPNFDPDDFYLSVPNPAQYTVILPDRNRKCGFLKNCVLGYGIGIIAFFIFICGLYVYKAVEWRNYKLTPQKMQNFTRFPKIFSDFGIQKLNGTSEGSKKLCHPRIIGYYKGWDNQIIRSSQLGKLSHVIFKYLVISKNGSTIEFKNNLEEAKFLDLKRRIGDFKETKLMISLDFGKNFKMEKSQTLITNINSFLDFHNWDGVDIDWRHPTPEDIPNQVKFLRNLKKSINPKKLISMVFGGLEWTYSYQMDLKNLIENLDFLNIFSMDYYNGNLTGPPAPLFSGDGEFRGFNVDRTMKYFVCNTKNSKKMNMGVPFYGKFWKNVKKEPKDGIWNSGNFENNILWRSINFKKSEKWHKYAMTPFILDSEKNTFLGFENQKSLKKKMEYLKKKNLGGLMIESIGDDDDMDSLLDTVVENFECVEKENSNLVNYKC
ncbi:hypothetical protein L3Y34_009620 [Caenorhabditis briggsae]|uniref:Chitinase II/V-like catalytic domain-containing protein n=1 Tax=Caenorhabditis briggsae TaxID=6238 RepID=A0AAE9A336_CAEBR|nr:hypothetical protein L3Y34_009620 [Caenorhabditis briggsae]